MTTFYRETHHIIRTNPGRLALFVLLYRLAAGTLYIRFAGMLLGALLRRAGYSYLTMSNLAAFLLRPMTAGAAMVLVLVGAFLLLIEVGGLVTAYQAAAYSRRIGIVSMMRGAVLKVWDEIRRKNWQLLLLAGASYLMMNSPFLLWLFTRVRPLNFVLEELLNVAWGRMGLLFLSVLLVMTGIPTMLVFFACMVEQKRFADGVARSKALVKGRWHGALLLLFGMNALLLAVTAVGYVVAVVIAAVVVTLFCDSHAAVAVMATVSRNLELVALFIGSCGASVVDFGALTVIYYRFETGRGRPKPWESAGFAAGRVGRAQVLAFMGTAAALSLLLAFDSVRNGSPIDLSVIIRTEVTAHRGSSMQAPENTLPAIEEAIQEMADFAEIDVQTTSDGVIVVCHDLNLDRLAGVDRQVGEMTFEELRKLDVGSWFSPEFAGTQIPTLEEVLELAKGRIKLNIELKNIGKNTDLPERVAELIHQHEMEDQCVITSVSLSYLKRVKAADENLHTGYILPAAYGRYYEDDSFDFISIRSSFVTAGLLERAHAAGKVVHAWTVDSRSEMRRMKSLDVDNIITDYPALAREILEDKEATAGLLEMIRAVLS